MNEWKKYKRKGTAEMRLLIPGEDIPVREGDMIARNPKNHEDQWLVGRKYFKENFELIDLKKSPYDSMCGAP